MVSTVTPTLRGLKQEDFHDFDGSLGYIVSTRESRTTRQDILSPNEQTNQRDSKVDHKTRTLAIKPEAWSSIPRTHAVEGEDQLPVVVL